MAGRRERRRTQRPDDPKEKRRYWKLEEEALDRTAWSTRFGTGHGPVIKQTTECMSPVWRLFKFHVYVRTALVYNDRTFRPFNDVITGFDCVYKMYKRDRWPHNTTRA
jgi:hypothetical protein